jgi:hypothetical protein
LYSYVVFEMGSTTPFLDEDFQDLRWVITERVVNGSPVWAAEVRDVEVYMAGRYKLSGADP